MYIEHTEQDKQIYDVNKSSKKYRNDRAPEPGRIKTELWKYK